MIVTLVTVETLLLVLLTLLVAGLLRSHAEILRRLNERERATDDATAEPRAGGVTHATDIAGENLARELVTVPVTSTRRNTLLAFLSTGCSTCEHFWDAFRRDEASQLPDEARLVVVTKDRSEERLARLRKIAPADVPVVMASSAWEAYNVPSSPYFVYVDGESGLVRGEGSATTWARAISLLEDSVAEDALESADGANVARRVRNGEVGSGTPAS